MGEEKNIGEAVSVDSTSVDVTSATPVPQEINRNTEEHSGEHSHHHSHHHHSSSHHRHHSGSHHRSGSHRHRRKSKISKMFSRLRRFFKKLNNKKRISLVCAIVLAVILVFSISIDVVQYVLYLQAEKLEAESKGGNDKNNILNIELVNPEGLLVSDAVNKYLSVNLLSDYNKNILVGSFSQGDQRYDVQNPVSLKLSTSGSVASMYKIEYADNPRYDNAGVEYFDSADGTFVFEHLYASTKYYYRVTAYTTIGVIIETGTFTTSDTPRILTVDGLYNVRDIGNWQTDSGKKIKQGLLIRGTELDGAVEHSYHLTYDGMSDMLNVLGIKFDMDLRNESNTPLGADALGSRVEHKYYGMLSYANIFTDEGRAAVREVFKDLADSQKYPIYLHGTYGADRTGTVCYLLEAMLGVSRGDCLKDYGLSNLPISNILSVETGLAEYGEGLSLKEQVEFYLISCGVTAYEIEAIRDIFLGE